MPSMRKHGFSLKTYLNSATQNQLKHKNLNSGINFIKAWIRQVKRIFQRNLFFRTELFKTKNALPAYLTYLRLLDVIILKIRAT